VLETRDEVVLTVLLHYLGRDETRNKEKNLGRKKLASTFIGMIL
jgi:hypothetical protein